MATVKRRPPVRTGTYAVIYYVKNEQPSTFGSHLSIESAIELVEYGQMLLTTGTHRADLNGVSGWVFTIVPEYK